MRQPRSRENRRVQVHLPYAFVLEKFDEILAEGINPEIYIDGEQLENIVPSELESIGRAFSERGLTITQHGPYLELNPGSADEEVRLFTVQRYAQAFRAAGFLRPKTMVLHAGYSERKFKADAALWLSQSMKTWPRFVEEAGRIGVAIAAENIFEKTPGTLKALVDALNSPAFGVCIDSGHLNVFSRAAMDEWFVLLGPHIKEVHLHDNNGNADEHLPLGEGAIDFGRFFSLLDEHGKDFVCTIEPHGEETIRRAIKAVRKFI